MGFEVALRMRNFAELQQRVAAGEIIPASEMAEKYFPLAEDYDRVIQWVRAQGFEVVRTDANRLAVFARGPVDAVGSALGVTFARVTADGAEYTSAVTAPSLPADLSPAVAGIQGLQPHIRMRHRLRMLAGGPEASGSTVPPFYPAQVAAAYNAAGLGLTGSGQTIAVFEVAYPVASDLAAFWSASGINDTLSNYLPPISVGGGPPANPGTGVLEEAALDVQWASAMAPGAKIQVYAANENDNAFYDEIYQQVYSDVASQAQPGMHQMSISFGFNESQIGRDYLIVEAQYMATLASAGMTVFAASGDGGSNPSLVTNTYNSSAPLQICYPGADPSVTGVGGTSLVLNADGTVKSETVWGGVTSVSNGSGATGGGISGVFSRPSWQTGAGLPAGSMRAVPDVAALGDPATGVAIIYSGAVHQFGGTSLSTPIWAGFCALINQARANAGQAPVGLLNAKLYPLLGTSSFRDITSGTNGAYSAGPGYDLCTGLGVPNVGALVQAVLGGGAVAPSIVGQTGSRTVTLGQTALFAVAAYGTPPLAYAWQALLPGAAAWANLGDNATYGGSSTSNLVVTGATYPMNGAQYRCVVSNAAGSATSSPAATLYVNPVGVTTLAGLPGAAGHADGAGPLARFNGPGGIRADAAGNLYVSDSANDMIRKVTPAGVASAVAGSPQLAGSADNTGYFALFNGPGGVAVDSAGNVYVADSLNYTVRKVTPAGVVTTIAGLAGTRGTADGTGSAARFYDPENLAIDPSGNLWVADGAGDTIRLVTPSGVVTTVAGSPRSSGLTNGTGASARFYFPTGIAFDGAGYAYVADNGNNAIRRISTSTYAVTTLAGNGSSGSADGTGAAARFYGPAGVAVDASGNVFVADSLNCTVREITPAGVVTTVAGSPGVMDSADGVGSSARFNLPTDLAFGASGVLYVADQYNNTVRRIVLGALAQPQLQVALPAGASLTAGQDATLSVTASGSAPLTYQWYLNNVAIAGATGASLSLSRVATSQAGTYTVKVTNNAGTATSSIAVAVAYDARLTNLSARANVGAGNSVLIAGFVVGGSATKQVLMRGVGPGLDTAFPGAFPAGETLASPVLSLTNPLTGALLAANSAWGSGATPAATLIQIFNQFGAFALASGSSDAVLLQTLGTGGATTSYTAQVAGAGGSSGVALEEIYDADSGTPSSRLINLSARAGVLTGDKILIGGFVIGGTTPETVLIRAVGPGLDYAFPGAFAPGSTMAQPVLQLFDGQGTVIASDTGWGNPVVAGASAVKAGILPATAANMALAGAFSLAAGSADSAMVVTLPPGNYTAEVTGLNGATGIALVEIYEVP
jgi:sugar lactone lactonase YvrE